MDPVPHNVGVGGGGYTGVSYSGSSHVRGRYLDRDMPAGARESLAWGAGGAGGAGGY